MEGFISKALKVLLGVSLLVLIGLAIAANT
jgi:hypothetical protein